MKKLVISLIFISSYLVAQEDVNQKTAQEIEALREKAIYAKIDRYKRWAERGFFNDLQIYEFLQQCALNDQCKVTSSSNISFSIKEIIDENGKVKPELIPAIKKYFKAK